MKNLIVIGNQIESNADFITVYPVTQTGAKVRQDIDTIWVEVHKPVGKDWVLISDIHAPGFDPELTEGRYLYLSNQRKIAVTLSGSHIKVKGIQYYILSNGESPAEPGELNGNREYTMAPAEKLFKITE
jgi:hypothetical protein